jgi:hypothetical protein
MKIEDIKNEYPNIKIEPLNGVAGCNIYLPGKLTLTVWFNKRKFYSNQLKVWRRFTNKADLLTIIGILGNLQLKQKHNPVTEPQKSGVQLCMDHLDKKIETIQKNNPEAHQLLTFCKTLKSEFHQYL